MTKTSRVRPQQPPASHTLLWTNDDLLVGRGSGYALAFIKTGRIVEEALRHPELRRYPERKS